LPDVPGKFSPGLLRRFDDVDPCSDIPLGTVPTRSLSLSASEEKEESNELRLMMSAPDGRKKPIVIARDASLDDLQREIQRKFRKRARKITNRHGQPIETLSSLSNDDLLNVVL